MYSNSISQQLDEQILFLQQLRSDSDLIPKLEIAVKWLVHTLQQQLPVLVCGNGGSAADALHISGELVGRFLRERSALNVVCLNANVSVLTAWANDYDSIFARQVEAHGKAGGVCWGISTIGNSPNVLRALEKAHELQMKTIALTGQGGGKLKDIADLIIEVPSEKTPQIQELHLPIYHFLCEQVERRIESSWVIQKFYKLLVIIFCPQHKIVGGVVHEFRF